jgi:hypothetical protein
MLAQIQAPQQQQQQQQVAVNRNRRTETIIRNHLGHVVVTAAASDDVPTVAAAVLPPVRATRTIHCSFCFESGHNIGHCNHTDVQYLYWEFMYFYRHYGEHFLCNNLSVLFEPHEAQVLLNYRPIKNIPLLEDNQIWERMVIDSMMSRTLLARYNKLHKKIVSMSYCPTLDYGRMDVVEPVMYETMREFENDYEERIGHDTIITGYHHTFTMNRHARFRRYDYDLEYMESIPITHRELINYYVEYIPPPMFGLYDTGRYGFARTQFVTVESQNENPDRFAQPVVVAQNQRINHVTTPTEPHPQWMMETPPRRGVISAGMMNVNRRREEVISAGMMNVNHRRGRGNTFTFEEMATITRLFDEHHKNEQPAAEVNIVPPPLKTEECFECPICMTEFAHSESVSLGCCVYSFCSDCYSNQYLTKDHREHNCMMCRKPFSKIEIYEEAIADKLRANCPSSIIHHQYYYQDDLNERYEREYRLPFPIEDLLMEDDNDTIQTIDELII